MFKPKTNKNIRSENSETLLEEHSKTGTLNRCPVNVGNMTEKIQGKVFVNTKKFGIHSKETDV